MKHVIYEINRKDKKQPITAKKSLFFAKQNYNKIGYNYMLICNQRRH